MFDKSHHDVLVRLSSRPATLESDRTKWRQELETIAIFCGIGLLVTLIAALCGAAIPVDAFF
ncbi:hypothetical protein [Bradyrhizobium sp. STM 3809]|uniref:hypothetical protein n=1 Tax=Bradyrhizobium sp. STM 3809 TaxID=551936 RepID=UPI000240A39A|nr:hypothetical protein [Bradyrhizobium sp. STM 3809]CCE03850.1 conserved hypothetical protein [Bradyrhizobium sp. STM 3809]